jgi:hypothetical protein
MLEEDRHDRALSLAAFPPALIPTVRMLPFLDYQSLSESDIEDCDRQIDHFKSTKTIICPTRKLYFMLMIVLRERRRLLSSSGDLLGAGELDELMQELSDFFLENALYISKAERVAQIQRQYDTEQSRLATLEVKWQRTLDALFQERGRAEERIAERSEARLSGFDNSMPASVPQGFVRLSANLLDLRERERHLIGSRRFSEAAHLHREFDRRQQSELIKRREEFFLSREHERALLEQRNRRTRASVDADWNRKVDQCRRQMDAELQPLRAAVANLLCKLITAKAEYIGEDDPILRTEPSLTAARDSGNQFRQTKTNAQGARPRTMAASLRPLRRGLIMMTTKKCSEILVQHGMRSAV